jgi:3-oxoacyl-[acyl-carrier protein] reductase
MSKNLLAGRVCLITGASLGFGFAISKAFIAQGAIVYGVARDGARLEMARDSLGNNFFPIMADIGVIGSVAHVVSHISRMSSRIDVLVNNAGVILDGPSFALLNRENFEIMLRTNLLGPVELSAAVAALMELQQYGRIINLTSRVSFNPTKGFGGYSVSKAALNMATRVLAQEFEGSNILVNAIDPGVAKTRLNPLVKDSPDGIIDIALYLASLPNGSEVTGRLFNKRLNEIDW